MKDETTKNRQFYNNQNANLAENAKEKNFRTFLPEPGFCLKTKSTSKNEKVFLNICKSSEVIEFKS